MENKSKLYEAHVSLQQLVATVNHLCATSMVNVNVLLDRCTNDNDVIPKI